MLLGPFRSTTPFSSLGYLSVDVDSALTHRYALLSFAESEHYHCSFTVSTIHQSPFINISGETLTLMCYGPRSTFHHFKHFNHNSHRYKSQQAVEIVLLLIYASTTILTATMAAVGAKKPFEESLEDLETLVDIYSRYPSDRLEYAEHGNTSILIERAIIAMQSASPDYLQSHRTLESSNRISSVISKLKKCDSEANFDGLSQLLKELLGSTRLASDRAMNIAVILTMLVLVRGPY